MKAMLHGFRRVDMTDDRNRPITGYSCFFGYETPGVTGEEVTKIFMRDDPSFSFSPAVGCFYDLDFSPRGKVVAVRPVKS